MELMEHHQSVDVPAMVSMETRGKHRVKLVWDDDSSTNRETIVYATIQTLGRFGLTSRNGTLRTIAAVHNQVNQALPRPLWCISNAEVGRLGAREINKLPRLGSVMLRILRPSQLEAQPVAPQPVLKGPLAALLEWQAMAVGAYSVNTLRAQKTDGAIFQAFCESRGKPYLPADTKSIRAFIEDRVNGGKIKEGLRADRERALRVADLNGELSVDSLGDITLPRRSELEKSWNASFAMAA